tara:strand:+ start:196 stop:531 length:336 start_codon:yes stop_codon:yes gene_type:complete
MQIEAKAKTFTPCSKPKNEDAWHTAVAVEKKLWQQVIEVSLEQIDDLEEDVEKKTRDDAFRPFMAEVMAEGLTATDLTPNSVASHIYADMQESGGARQTYNIDKIEGSHES